MPEIINISNLTPTENYYINDSGVMVSHNSFHYYLIKLPRGRYKFKFYANAVFDRSVIRVIQYNLSNVFIARLASYYVAEASANTIYTLTAEFYTESIIGLSSNKNAILMEIEKL